MRDEFKRKIRSFFLQQASMIRAGIFVVFLFVFVMFRRDAILSQFWNNLVTVALIPAWSTIVTGLSPDICLVTTDVFPADYSVRGAFSYDPQNSRFLNLEAMIKATRGDCLEAVEIWNASLAQDGKNPFVPIWLAMAYFNLDQPMKISDIFEDSYSNTQAYFFTKRGNAASLEDELAWAKLHFYASPSRSTARGLFKLYEKEGGLENMLPIWKDMTILLSSEHPDYWWALGQQAEYRSDWQAAHNIYVVGIGEMSEFDSYFYVRGARMCELLKDYQCALDLYEDLIAQDSQNLEAYLAAAKTAALMGQHNLADKWCQTASDIFPDSYQVLNCLSDISPS